jgi:excisionase family DNA binding protein
MGMVDAISPGSYLTVAQAAQRLGISARRVNHLVGAGDLRSSQLGAITVIPAADVERRRSLKPGDGRRLTTSNAWGVLALASGERPPWLAADTRYRLGRLLAKHGLLNLRARLVERGEQQAFRAHPSLLRAIREDPALMLSGVTAAAELRLGLLAGDTVDAYVDERALATLIARYGLRVSQEPNVILRMVHSFMPSWPPSHVAPRAAVALDLIEQDDPRIRQVGTELLGRLTG